MNRKRIIIILAALMLLALGTALAVEYADPAVAKVQFNLRKEMSTDSDAVANVPLGANLTVNEYPNSEWCRVTFRGKTGYAKTSWLRFRVGQNHVIARSATEPQATQAPAAEAAQTDTGTPEAAAEAVVPTLKGYNIREVVIESTGSSVGESDTDEIRYIARAKVQFNIRAEPSESAKKVRQIRKGGYVRVLAVGDDWCKVQSTDGKYTGYAKSRWVFHYHSVDPFKYEVPGYSTFKPTGYVRMTSPVHITDRRNLYKGADLQEGDLVAVKLREEGDYDIVLRRDFVTVAEDTAEYTPFVPWNEAKEGDIIGGFTQFYGKNQGWPYQSSRRRNIALAMSRMDGTVILSGERYAFQKNIGPVTEHSGYSLAGITGGEGSGIGGGICHTSTLTYDAALSLPFYIYEREPHTDEGTHYAVLEFDATVGTYSDMIFYNTLPYAVKEHAFIDKASGCITILYECLETKDAETLANWDWKTLDIPQSREERIINY